MNLRTTESNTGPESTEHIIVQSYQITAHRIPEGFLKDSLQTEHSSLLHEKMTLFHVDLWGNVYCRKQGKRPAYGSCKATIAG